MTGSHTFLVLFCRIRHLPPQKRFSFSRGIALTTLLTTARGTPISTTCPSNSTLSPTRLRRRRHSRRRHRRQAPLDRPHPRNLGALKGVVENGDLSPWRLSFLGGLVAAGVVDGIWDPNQIAEPGVSLAKTVLAGLLVGAGSAMGNGCTSGHGICGNSRMSPRSMAYTGIFMVSGFIVASVFNNNGDLGINSDFSAIDNMVTPAAETLTRLLHRSRDPGLPWHKLSPPPRPKRTTATRPSSTRPSTPSPRPSPGSRSASASPSAACAARRRSAASSPPRGVFRPEPMLVMGGATALSIPGFAIANKKKAPACTRSSASPRTGRSMTS